MRFKKVKGFEKYEVGYDGSVWSTDYNHTGTRQQIKTCKDKDGYRVVWFVINGKRYKKRVARLVAIAFRPNPKNKPQVNHKDRIRDNDHADNLEWVTSQENTIHGWENGREVSQNVIDGSRERFTGANNPKAKVNEATVLSIRRLRSKGKSLKDIAERHDISVAQVSSIATGKSWASIN